MDDGGLMWWQQLGQLEELEAELGQQPVIPAQMSAQHKEKQNGTDSN